MKTLIRKSLLVASVCAALTLPTRAEDKGPGKVDFGEFTPAAGTEFVEVNITSNLITMALDLAKKAEPDIVEALKGLKGVRVNVMGLTDENRGDIQKRIAGIRKDLDSNGWERVVTAIQEKNDVGVFIRTRGTEAVEGVVVTVVQDGKQAVLINVVGDIRPEKLAMVGERFNIEPLKHLGIPEKH